MSKFIIVLLASVSGLAGLAAAAPAAQAQIYVQAGGGLYVGERVQVYAGDGAWYAATVLQLGGDAVLVRYVGPRWYNDEWVDLSRVSLSGATVGIAYQPAIQVYWGSSWYNGTLLGRRGDLYHVHYNGRSEWVRADRWHHRGHAHRAHWERRGYHRGHDGYRPSRGDHRRHEARGHHDRRGDRGDRGNRGGRGRGNDHGRGRGNHR